MYRIRLLKGLGLARHLLVFLELDWHFMTGKIVDPISFGTFACFDLFRTFKQSLLKDRPNCFLTALPSDLEQRL